MSKKKLSITQPFITTFPDTTNLFSIILNNKYSMDWILTNYINIEGPSDETLKEKYFGMSFYCSDLLWEECPYITLNTIDKNIINVKWDSIVEFIIDCIDMDCYLRLYLDRYYIPVSSDFKRRHISHKTLVYGYDKHEQKINIADFYKEGKYSFEEISFSDIKNSYEIETSKNERKRIDVNHIKIIKLINKKNYNFDINLMYREINNYLDSENPREMQHLPHNQADSIYCNYGINIYKSLITYINYLKEGKKVYNIFGKYYLDYVDLRPFKVLLDHKTVMVHRFDYLIKNKYIKQEYYSIMKKAISLKNSAVEILSLLVEFIQTKNNKILDDVIELLELLRSDETHTLKLLLEAIIKDDNRIYYQKPLS